jgi:Fic family protein
MESIEFPAIDFQSQLVERIVDLERIRGELGVGSTPVQVFLELHALFKLLTSIASARIEGNHTTILDAVMGIRENTDAHGKATDSIQEILNIQKAMAYIDSTDPAEPVTQKFIRELHRIAVDGLLREGDSTPGEYRTIDVSIERSSHHPPGHYAVHADMDTLVNFVNRKVKTHEQLLHVAIAHHRFLWIHPFKNGNGRVSRLLTYAMLSKHGFVSPTGLRAINPTAVFGSDRNDYYANLSAADDLSAANSNAGLLTWCTFFMDGIYGDLQRLRSLQDFGFVKDRLIFPALDRFLAAGKITLSELAILRRAVTNEEVKAGDLLDILPGTPSARSVAIHALVDRKLLQPQKGGGRIYHLSLAPNEFTPFLVGVLDTLGYLPPILKDS